MHDDKPPLNILQVLEPSGGGSGRHFVDLCGALIARGHKVTAVYSPVRAEQRFVEELMALPLSALYAVSMKRAPHPSDLTALMTISGIMRREGPFDIIHGHSSKAGYLIRLTVPGLRRVPRIYTPHAFRTMDPTLGSKGRLLFGTIEGLLGRYFSSKVICVSDDEYTHARALGIPDKLLATVVNGVAKPQETHRDAIRAHMGFGHDNFVFGFVGRLSPQKAPERLVRAFAAASQTFGNARLAMVGFGELEAQTRALADELGVTGKLYLSSDIPGPAAMQAFDALVMPSRYEAMSYAMLEAAAAGKPLVLSDVGGASTVLTDGENGRLVANSDDTDELAAALAAFVDPIQAQRYTQAAQARKERYTLDKMVDETLAVYRSVLPPRGSSQD